jgi:hypothetical protein
MNAKNGSSQAPKVPIPIFNPRNEHQNGTGREVVKAVMRMTYSGAYANNTY